MFEKELASWQMLRMVFINLIIAIQEIIMGNFKTKRSSD